MLKKGFAERIRENENLSVDSIRPFHEPKDDNHSRAIIADVSARNKIIHKRNVVNATTIDSAFSTLPIKIYYAIISQRSIAITQTRANSELVRRIWRGFKPRNRRTDPIWLTSDSLIARASSILIFMRWI